MGRFEIEQRRLGGAEQAPKPLTMSELLKKARNSRKQARLRGEEGAVLGQIAQAVDQLEGLGFAERRVLLITEAGKRIENGDYRAGALLGITVNAVNAAKATAQGEESRELFEEAGLKISQILDLK